MMIEKVGVIIRSELIDYRVKKGGMDEIQNTRHS